MNNKNTKTGTNYNNNRSSSASTDSRAKTLRFYSIGSVIILITIVVLLNILITGLLGDALTFDFSSNNQNTITQQTRDFIDSMPENTHIRIVGLLERPTNLQNTPYEYIVPLLDDYEAKSNGKITVEYKDPELYPSIVNELDPNNVYNLEEGTYVIQYNGQIQVISPLDCFTIDEDYLIFYNAYLPTSNNVEYVFTNTMARLLSGFNSKAYIITGLQDDPSTAVKTILNALGCDVETLQVADGFAIPDDCDLLILNGPNMDIPEKVMLEIENYLAGGGKFICAVNFTDANSKESFENLNAVLNTMNINIDPYIIKENDVNYMLDDSGYSSLVSVNSTFLELSTSDFEMYYTFKNSYIRPVRILTDSESSVMSVAIGGTSENAYCVKVADSGVTQYGEAGRYYTSVYSSLPNYVQSPEVIVFGTTDFTSDSYISAYGMNDDNVKFFKSCARYLLGADSAATVEVPTRGISDYALNGEKVTETSSTVVLAVFMIAIPLLFLVAAAIVYEKRKNL